LIKKRKCSEVGREFKKEKGILAGQEGVFIIRKGVVENKDGSVE